MINIIQKYTSILPKSLLDAWGQYGFIQNENQFFLCNPDEYKGLMEDFLETTVLADHYNLHVIARDAFGRLYIWEKEKGNTIQIDIQSHTVFYITPPLDEKPLAENENIVMSDFLEKNYISPDKDEKTIELVEKFGKLDSDEIFSYKHSLVFGGENKYENIEKSDLFITADIQLQMEQPAFNLIDTKKPIYTN